MNPAAAALTLLALSSATARAQSWFDEVRVGSERELYLRVLQLATRADALAWEIRPLVRSDSALLAVPWQPWGGVADDTLRSVRVLRPHVVASVNQSFPWRTNSSAAWEGKGANAVVTGGVAATYWWFSLRIEPAITYAANLAFPLDTPSVGFRDAMRPSTIDEPQRFGSVPLASIYAGETAVRADVSRFTVGLSNERIFWGPGVRHAMLFAADALGFPHVFFGTAQPLRTRFGRLHGQVVYGRLDESKWAPPAPTSRRFGAGFISAWDPPSLPLTLGVARFYHRAWPQSLGPKDFLVPFGALFFDAERFAGAVPDNQLATGFFSLRVRQARLELFGEFARNDRSSDLRDLALEPEHNSAWLVGFLKAFAVDSLRRSFWSLRYEGGSGRISAIQQIPRVQASFYEHTPITQGHTNGGILLGTPLLDRSGGFELGVDRWSASGRTGMIVTERQMPPDLNVGMPADRARTQWDARFSILRFIGKSELSYELGHVWDLNRFPKEDVGNLYLVVGWRQYIGSNLRFK